MDATTESSWAFVRPVRRRGRVAWPLAVVAIGAVALALVAALGLRGGVAAQGQASGAASGGPGVYGGPGAFQLVPGDQPSVAVLGVGEADAPAVSGRLQLIVRAVDPFAVAGQVPVGAPGQPPPLTEAQVQPVADAIAVAGAAPRNVEVLVSRGFGGPFGPGAAQVLVDLDRSTLGLTEELVAAGTEAAGANGLYVESVGAGFEAADCDELLREARQAAAEDARRRAEGVAEALGLRLGEVLLASESPTYDGGAGFGCSTPIPGVSETGTYFPPFDPSSEPEVELYAQLNVAYAIV